MEKKEGAEKRKEEIGEKNSRELKRKYCKIGNRGVKYP